MSDNKRMMWLTIAILLFAVMYIFDNASVGDTGTFINEYIWRPLHESNQYISFVFLVVSVLILLYHLVIALIPERQLPVQKSSEFEFDL